MDRHSHGPGFGLACRFRPPSCQAFLGEAGFSFPPGWLKFLFSFHAMGGAVLWNVSVSSIVSLLLMKDFTHLGKISFPTINIFDVRLGLGMCLVWTTVTSDRTVRLANVSCSTILASDIPPSLWEMRRDDQHSC